MSKRSVTDTPVEFDKAVYDRIVDDMRRHAGPHAPSAVWRDEALFPDSKRAQRSPTFADMVRPWIGVAAEPASAEDVQAYRRFLAEHGLERFAPPDTAAQLHSGTATVADLRSRLDVALVRAHVDVEPGRPVRLLEVGGGYGRLAQAFLRMQDWHGTYVLVDAVPASLYYAHAYLRKALPERSIGAHHVDGAVDLDRFDCFVVPSWRLPLPSGPLYDAAIAISTLQEMTAEQVSHYLHLFDETVRPGGVIYLSNSRVYKYRGGYRYPARWRLRFKADAPFSYLPYKPAEVFTRAEGDWTAPNAVLDREYLEGMSVREHDRADQRLAAVKASTDAAIERLQKALATARETAERRRLAIRTLEEKRIADREAIGRLQERLAAEREAHRRDRA